MMNHLKRSIWIITVPMTILFSISQKAAAIVQAPAQGTWAANIQVDHTGKEITLLSNPVLKSGISNMGQESEKDKNAVADQENMNRKEDHKGSIKKNKEEKKRLKEKQKEEKRRKEIKACCGVSAGSKDRRILERIVEAEAGGETIRGRLLVANVVLNRVKDKEFPSTVRGVVFSHKGSKYQFSPVSDGRYYSVKVSKGTKKAVDQALHGKDPSKGALYFMERAHAYSGSVRWFDRSLTKLFRYGCHEFYK